jgi:hypothetical protein
LDQPSRFGWCKALNYCGRFHWPLANGRVSRS